MTRSILMLVFPLLWVGLVPDQPVRPSPIEQNKAVVRGYMEEILNNSHWDEWDRFFGEAVVFNEMPISRDWIRNLSSSLRGAFPDLRLTIEDQIAEGDKVVTRVTFHGTHLGEFAGIAGTGNEVSYSGIAVDRIEDGKVVEMWHWSDSSSLMRQLKGEP